MAWAPPTLKIALHPGHVGRDQHLRALAAVRLGRGAEDDLLHPGHAGDDGGHDDRGGVRGPPRRGVEADPLQRAHHLPRALLEVDPAPALLLAVEGGHPLRRQAQVVDQGGGDLVVGAGDLLPAGLEGRGGHPVQALRDLAQGGVAPGAHLLPDPLHERLGRQLLAEDGGRARR